MPIEIGPTRALSAGDVRAVRSASGASQKSAGPVKSGPTVVRSDALDPGQPPVDTERVAVIRHAVETGNYPMIPARVADAMIAAGLLLRNGK
jgi:negative regulator of flagellin synthesis FlgM